MESINKKGNPYIKSIPVKRILSVLFRFDTALVLFIIIWIIEEKRMFSLVKLIEALIGLSSFGNSCWYIFAILLEYVFTYLSFRFIKNNNISFMILLSFNLIYIPIIFFFRESSYYNTVLCYPLGVFWSMYGQKICCIINKNFKNYISCFLVVIGAFFIVWLYEWNIVDKSIISIIFSLIMGLLFTILFVFITMKVQFHNNILNWLENIYLNYIFFKEYQ